VREEVKVSKEEQDTVEAQETIRREELDVDTQGRGVVIVALIEPQMSGSK